MNYLCCPARPAVETVGPASSGAHPPLLVVSLGIQGNYDWEHYRKHVEQLCAWLARHPEADNLARDRSSEAAQGNTKTEHILSLLDGTLR